MCCVVWVVVCVELDTVVWCVGRQLKKSVTEVVLGEKKILPLQKTCPSLGSLWCVRGTLLVHVFACSRAGALPKGAYACLLPARASLFGLFCVSLARVRSILSFLGGLRWVGLCVVISPR